MIKLILVPILFSSSLFAQESRFKIEKIEISGSTAAEKSNKELVELPLQVDLITEEDLSQIGATTLKGALSDKSNIEFIGGPRSNIQKPQIRGLGENRVLIVIDGVKQSQGSIHRGNVFSDLSLLKSIEVVKGSGSSLYGSSAMGGVISMERKMADDFLKSSKKLGAEINVKHLSAANTNGSRATVYTKTKKLGVVTSFSNTDSGNLTLGEGQTLDHSSSLINSINANVYYKTNKNNRTEIFAERFEEKGLWPSNPSEYVTSKNYLADTENLRESFQVRHKYNPKNKSVDASVNVFTNKVQAKYDKSSENKKQQNTTQSDGIELSNTTEVLMGENILATTYGAEYIDEKNVGIENGGPNGRYPNGRSQLTSVFLQPSFESVGNFRIVPGVRYDRHSVESSDQSFSTKVDEELSSKLALVYFVNPGFSFYTSYGEAFMAPKIQELYAYGEHYSFKAGPMTVVNNFIPNPDLTSEKSVTYELGTHFKKENKVKNSFFKVEASIYETQAEDFVDFEFDKNRMGGGTTKFVNKDDVRMQGAEASIAGGYQRLEGKVSYTTIKSEDLKTNQPLDQTPGNKTKISGRVILSQKSKIKLGTSLTHYAKRDAAESGSKSELEYNEYFTQDLYINWEPKISVFERTRIGLRLNNIYDRSYLQHGTPIPGVGRDVRLNLTINL